jgi:hypothetical protein
MFQFAHIFNKQILNADILCQSPQGKCDPGTELLLFHD